MSAIELQLEGLAEIMLEHGHDYRDLQERYEYVCAKDVFDVLSPDGQMVAFRGIDVVCDVQMPSGYVALKKMSQS